MADLQSAGKYVNSLGKLPIRDVFVPGSYRPNEDYRAQDFVADADEAHVLSAWTLLPDRERTG
jgi:hypothetical protein